MLALNLTAVCTVLGLGVRQRQPPPTYPADARQSIEESVVRCGDCSTSKALAEWAGSPQSRFPKRCGVCPVLKDNVGALLQALTRSEISRR
jgi:hypothetical protein